MVKLVSNRLIYPQEIEVWYVIPAIRRELTVEMKRRGMEQKEIASLLGITGAAVSQYATKKRATEIKFAGRLKEEIKESVDRIMKEKRERVVLEEIERIMELPEIREQICRMHKGCKSVGDECRLCGWREE